MLFILEDDELALNDKDMIVRFEQLKKEMKHLPLYDKEIFMKVQVFDWMVSASEMLSVQPTDEDLLSII